MSVLLIVLLVVIVVALLAFLLVPGNGPLGGVRRATDQRNEVSGLGKPLRFHDDLERPRDEGGR